MAAFATVKERRREAWASGDSPVLADRTALVAERLCDAADLYPGMRVLDVAGGGSAAIAASRLGCIAVGVDDSYARIEQGRLRTAAEGLHVELVAAEGGELPFPTATFDAVTSVFGSLPAAELLRVCRPGGTIALTRWAPTGFMGLLFQAVGAHVAPRAPLSWGTLGQVRDLEERERTVTFRFRSAEELVRFLRRWDTPTLRAFASLDADGRRALERDLVALASEFGRLGPGAIAVSATYLETIAIRS
jgi:SAM-dependent methyltransferase